MSDDDLDRDARAVCALTSTACVACGVAPGSPCWVDPLRRAGRDPSRVWVCNVRMVSDAMATPNFVARFKAARKQVERSK
jgi:hypothetical protein